MNNLIKADLIYELNNYEEILKAALNTSNMDIIDFCADTVYPCYVDLCGLLGLKQNEDVENIYHLDLNDDDY